MAGTGDFHVARLFSLCEKGLSQRALSVEPTTDFEAAERRMSAMAKQGFTPMLSSKFHDFSRDDAFWLFLRKGDTDIAGVAARFDRFHSESLSEYWIRTYARMYSLSPESVSHTHAPAAMNNIRGDVAYLGEFFFHPKARGSRNLYTLFTQMLFCYCHLHWRPCWQYAFVRKPDVEKGFASVYGFTIQVPGAQTWLSPPEGRVSSEYLVALPKEDLLHNARFYTENPEFFLGEDKLKSVEKLRT